MKKSILSLTIILLCVFSIIIFNNNDFSSSKNLKASVIAFNNDDEIIKAAQNGLNSFLALIPEGNEKAYGFEKREDFLKAEVGSPFEVYTLSTEFLKVNDNNLKKYLIKLEQWRVPIIVNSHLVSFLTVEKENNSYKCVDMGGAELAAELDSYQKYFDKIKQQRAILRLYQLQSDFLIIMEQSNDDVSMADYYPLKFTRNSFQKYILFNDGAYKFDAISSAIRAKYSEEFNPNK